MKELVIFDVDNTIVKGQSQGLFISFLYKKGYVSLYYYLRLITWVFLYKLGIVKDPLSAMRYGLSFIKGKSISEVESIVNIFFEDVLQKNIYKEAVRLIEEHRKNGRFLILLSNAPDILINRLANYLKIENYLSTNLESNNGIYTGNIFGEIMYGEQKLLAINKYIQSNNLSLAGSWGYGDHDSDTFLLSKMTHPYAVNPSKNLEKVAIKNNWPILTFKL